MHGQQNIKKKKVSYGFSIINFCNPGEHYETPCTISIDFEAPTASIKKNVLRNVTRCSFLED